MWLDLLALGVIAAYALLGVWRGGFRTGMALLALAAAYTAAVLGAGPLGPFVGAAFGMPELLAIPLASTLLFLAVYLVVGLAGFGLRRAGIGDDEPSARGRFLGGVFGATRGALVALLLAYSALWLDALRAAGHELPVPPVAGSLAGRWTGEAVGKGVSAALGDGAGARMAAAVAARPAGAVEDLQALVDSPSVQAVREDPLFWSFVEQDKIQTALTTPAATQLLNDEILRERLYGLGLISESARNDRRMFRSEMTEVLHQVSVRVRGLREDPEVQRLMADPEVVAMVQSGNTVGLVAHPGFRALVERVASQPVATP